MILLMQVLSSSSVFFSVGLGMGNDVQFDPGKHRTSRQRERLGWLRESGKLGSRQYQPSEDCFLFSVVLCEFVPASG